MPAGCLPEFFSHPPTGPSRSDNTWLLGVWEMPKLSAEDGSRQGTYRAVLAPLTSDRMMLTLEDRNAEGRVLRQMQARAWISRVGQATFLVAEVIPDGTPLTSDLEGTKFLVVGYQLLDPLNVRLRELMLPPEAYQAGRFHLRRMIRQAFNNGTLFQARSQIWTKTGEIYWRPDGDPATDTFTPTRNLPPPAPKASPQASPAADNGAIIP